ncbi:hypothetical protein NXF25_008444 [Crotalus adamanteus]|uniref:Uncharacterized protein n=1 Tax=Crotalus adamanteus TaxID=8729 RepID=A0AAW1BQF1_CROAD
MKEHQFAEYLSVGGLSICFGMYKIMIKQQT